MAPFRIRLLERLTAKYGLPWRKPSVFPRNSVMAARVAAAFASEPWIGAFIRLGFIANFYDDRDLNDRVVVADLVAAAGAEANRVLTVALNGDGSRRLRENTAQAIDQRIFGAPTFIVGDELFGARRRSKMR